MWRLAILLSCASCNEVFDLKPTVSDNGETPACFADDFDDGTIDQSFWHVSDPTNSLVIIAEAEGVLAFAIPATSNGYNSLDSRTYDLAGASAEIELVQPPVLGGQVDCALEWTLDSTNSYSMIYSAANLVFRMRVAGQTDQTLIAYSGSQHRFWRIGHDATTDEIRFETSLDGSDWVVRRQTPRALPLDQMYVRLVAGGYAGPDRQNNIVQFDSFAVRSPGC